MNWIKCQLKTVRDAGRHIECSAGLMKLLSIGSGQKIRLQFGPYHYEAKVKKRKNTGDALRIPIEAAAALHLPDDGKLRAMVKAGIRPVCPHTRLDMKRGPFPSGGEVIKCFELGPLIGLLTSGSPRSPQAPFGNRSGYIKPFLQHAAADFGFICAFRLSDVDFEQETIDGFFPDAKGNWHNQQLPFPHAVHNRLPTRSGENSREMHEFRKTLERMQIPMYNDGFFDKWDVHRMLMRHPAASRYIPETYPAPDEPMIVHALSEHPAWYLKPVDGCLGIGIIRLQTGSSNRILMETTLRGKPFTKLFDEPDQLMKWFRQSRRHPDAYLLQQAVPLKKLNGEPADFRVHMNRDKSGRWLISAICAKQAGKGSVTTHIRNGGAMHTCDAALDQMFGPDVRKQIRSRLERAAFDIAEAIGLESLSPVGELGLDLGLDASGEVWFFEANAKPGRCVFKLEENKEAGRKAYRHLYDFAVRLSERQAVYMD